MTEFMKIKTGGGKPIRFNVLVAGEQGLGKKTFVKTLLRGYVDTTAVDQYCAKSHDGVEIASIGSFAVESDIGQCEMVFYTTPGYGDRINNNPAIELVRDFLERRHQAWRNIDGQRMMAEDRNYQDSRIHCVFYFIAPNRMKENDHKFMKLINNYAPIVPVIAQADALTHEERERMLSQVSRSIQRLYSQTSANKHHPYDFHETACEDFLDLATIPASPSRAPAAVEKELARACEAFGQTPASHPSLPAAGTTAGSAAGRRLVPKTTPFGFPKLADSLFSVHAGERTPPPLLCPEVTGVASTPPRSLPNMDIAADSFASPDRHGDFDDMHRSFVRIGESLSSLSTSSTDSEWCSSSLLKCDSDFPSESTHGATAAGPSVAASGASLAALSACSTLPTLTPQSSPAPPHGLRSTSPCDSRSPSNNQATVMMSGARASSLTAASGADRPSSTTNSDAKAAPPSPPGNDDSNQRFFLATAPPGTPQACRETQTAASRCLPRVRNVFAVVCADRVHSWGTLRVEDENASDFPRLRRLFLSTNGHIQGLIDDTQRRTVDLFPHRDTLLSGLLISLHRTLRSEGLLSLESLVLLCSLTVLLCLLVTVISTLPHSALSGGVSVVRYIFPAPFPYL